MAKKKKFFLPSPSTKHCQKKKKKNQYISNYLPKKPLNKEKAYSRLSLLFSLMYAKATGADTITLHA